MLLNGRSSKQKATKQSTSPSLDTESAPPSAITPSAQLLPAPPPLPSRRLPVGEGSTPAGKTAFTTKLVALARQGTAEPPKAEPSRSPHKPKGNAIAQLGMRTRAALMAIALGILPILALGGAAYLVANRTAAHNLAEVEKKRSLQVADKLSQFMAERFNDIQVLANLPILRNPKLRTLTLPQDKQLMLEQTRAIYNLYSSITLFDLNGNPLLQTSGAPLDNPKQQRYFQEALKTGRPTISGPDSSTGVATISFAASVRDGATSQTIGIIVTRLPLTQVEALLQGDYDPTDQYYLFDASGTIFLTSDKHHVSQPINTVFPGMGDVQAKGEPQALVSDELLNGQTVWQTLSQPDLILSETGQYLLGFAPTQPLRTLPNLQWGVVSSADLQAVVMAQRHLTVLVGLGTLGTAALIGSIALASAKRASQMIQGNLQSITGELQSLEQRRARSAERSRLLSEIVNNMRQSLRQEDILHTTVSELRYALRTDRVIVYFFESDWCGHVVAESVGLGWRKILGEKVQDPFREGLIERYRNGRVRVMNDIYTENLTHCHVEILEGFQIKASIVAPIVQNDQLIGLLCAHQCEHPRRWEEEDVDLFAKLSSQLGYVLDQTSLLQKQTRSADRSRLLNEIVSTMRRSLKEDDILHTTVSELRYALHTDRVIVYQFDNDWNGTIIAESVALGWQKILGKTVHDRFREGLIERYRNGRVRVMHNIHEENLTPCHLDILDGFQIKASIVAPILQNGQLIGLLCAHHCTEPRQWQDEDVDLFGKLAIQLGFALDQSALLRKQIRSADRSRLLNEIVVSMRRSLKVEEILNITVGELRYALNTDRVIVYRFHDDWNGTIIAESVAAGWLKILGETVSDPFRDGLIERYRNGRVRVMNDIYAESLTDCHRDILESFQVRASIIAPILQNKKLIGLLCAHHCSDARQWEEEEVDLFTQLAIQLGFALDQAALLDYTEKARQEARQEADAKTEEQRQQKEFLQRRALELLREIEPVSRGDLTVHARVTPDEVGTIANSCNTITKALREIVEQVQETSKSMTASATNNESAVSTLSRESQRQMQAIHEALEQIQAMVLSIQGVADCAKRAELSVQTAAQNLEAGDEAMDRTVSGISAIRETVSETAKKVKRLGEASQKISRVVSLIHGFAAQTNLLALNAAVEASRAGEEGKGFRVVAEEVRSLAQQSAAATAEIGQLVEEIQTQTNEVVTAMEEGTEQVVTGTQLVEESRQRLSQISGVSHHINQLVQEIAQAAVVQTSTSVTVSATMERVAAIADETSKQSDTVANSFTHLLQVAKELQVSVAQFKVRN